MHGPLVAGGDGADSAVQILGNEDRGTCFTHVLIIHKDATTYSPELDRRPHPAHRVRSMYAESARLGLGSSKAPESVRGSTATWAAPLGRARPRHPAISPSVSACPRRTDQCPAQPPSPAFPASPSPISKATSRTW